MVERVKKFFNRKEKEFFPGQEKGERVIFFIRRHPLSFLGFIAFSVIMIAVPLVMYFFLKGTTLLELNEFGQRLIVVIGSAYVLFILGFFLVGWIDYYLDVVIVTDSRIVDVNQDRLFARSIAEANLADVEDVNAEVKGILNTLFHFGTVYVQTAGTATNFEFKYIPHPYKIAKMIADLHQKAVEEAEMREAVEIGETIAEKENEFNGADIPGDKEKQPKPEDIQYRKGVGIMREKREERERKKEKKLEERKKQYQEGTGWPEMETKKRTDKDSLLKKKQEENSFGKKETENEDKNKGDVGHDDLQKGGEVDL